MEFKMGLHFEVMQFVAFILVVLVPIPERTLNPVCVLAR